MPSSASMDAGAVDGVEVVNVVVVRPPPEAKMPARHRCGHCAAASRRLWRSLWRIGGVQVDDQVRSDTTSGAPGCITTLPIAYRTSGKPEWQDVRCPSALRAFAVTKSSNRLATIGLDELAGAGEADVSPIEYGLQRTPVETRARVDLSAGRDVLVDHDIAQG